MKNILFTISLFLVLISCKNEAKNEFVILKGSITNPKAKTLRVSSLTSSFKAQIAVNEDGTFIDTLKTDANNIMIYDGRNIMYLFVEHGNELAVNYNAKDFKNTITFSGTGKEINNYLLVKKNTERKVAKKYTDNFYTLNEADYLAYQKQLKSEILNLFANTSDLPKSFREKEKRNIEYTYLNNLIKYESNHRYYSKKPNFVVSDGFVSDLESLDYNNEIDFNFSYAYNSLVKFNYKKVARDLSESEAIDYDIACLKAINAHTNQTIKNILLYDNAKFGITYTSDFASYYSEFMKGSTNDENNKKITDSYTVLKTVAPGKTSPKFIHYLNNAGGTTSLDDLKGKYVYIDVWATWCGPCKAEIPFLKEVEKKYHGKDIEFVSISVDKEKDKEKWQKMIIDKELGGTQLFADNDFKSQFIQDYFIKGIPKFILLDPNGIIINANAPRPSNEKLIELFKELNI